MNAHLCELQIKNRSVGMSISITFKKTAVDCGGTAIGPFFGGNQQP